MTPLEQIYIAGSSVGLITDKKPFLIPDQAFTDLENAYIWRDRVKKRQGLEFLGRLRLLTEVQALGVTDGSGVFTGNLVTIFSLDVGSEIEPGSISIVIGGETFTEPVPPDGTLTNGTGGTGTINYLTGDITVTTSPALLATAATITFASFPGLPVMGIWQRDVQSINNEQTIFFDTKRAYIFVGTGFQEFIPGTTWNGSDSDFFWAANYRGILPSDRYFFVTNNVNNAGNPIRYSNGSTWTNFVPIVADVPESAAQSVIWQTLLIIPYYGRLLFLNTTEGLTASGRTAGSNFFNRCRFSQIGDPTALDAWRTDIFGKGGFIDAPTNESIVSATFYKNTLIVGFERSTWQLRYLGEYGLPFLWERISSDFGTESTFSTILFDQGVLSVGDRAIISSAGTNVTRIDEQIPDQVFDFRNDENGLIRVHGIRDFQRELVFWCYSDAQQQNKFPNRVLVYNYRNNTYARFRDNVTCFGTFQPPVGITWDSFSALWTDYDITWSDVDSQSEFPRIVSGNQQGFIHYYGYTTIEEYSLSITGIDLTADPIRLTVINHNLENEEIIRIRRLVFTDGAGTPLPTNINDQIFQVALLPRSDPLFANTLLLYKWVSATQSYSDFNYSNFSITPVDTATYIGGGRLILFPKLYVETKDFNPYQSKGMSMKLSYLDFLTDATVDAKFSVKLFVNSSLSVEGNVLIGNTASTSALESPYYVPNSDYAWHRFYSLVNGQFIRIVLTLDDELMNTLSTHQQTWILNAMCLHVRPGSKNFF